MRLLCLMILAMCLLSAAAKKAARCVMRADGVDAKTGRHYTEMADFDFLVRKYMIKELRKNYDGNKSSQYFFKDSDEVDPLLYAGPVWDYDSAWGNYAPAGAISPVRPDGMSVAEADVDYAWWPALYRQADFKATVRSVYDEQLRPMLLILTRASDAQGAVKPMDEYGKELHASAEMNFARWRVLNHKARVVILREHCSRIRQSLTESSKERHGFLDDFYFFL